MKKVVIIGSGAGGATAAKELQGEFQVTVVEAGGSFKPFAMNLGLLERLRITGLFCSEKILQAVFPAYRVSRTSDAMILVHGAGIGGSTTLTCGNAVRVDTGLKRIGIDLDSEFAQLEKEIHVTADHQHLWSATTRRLFTICESDGMRPYVVPKAGHYEKCRNCGHCTLGCRYGVKWDSSVFIGEAVDKGARIVRNCTALKIVVEGSRAAGVMTNRGFLAADIVIAAAGGIGTPALLENSGIRTDDTLFVDPVLCVAARYENVYQNRGLPMPFAVQMDGYIISPYFDQLSFFFNRKWHLPGKDIVSLMIKLADENKGRPESKVLTANDWHKLEEGTRNCKEILSRLGVSPESIFAGTLNAGHPGGMLPLTPREAESFHNDRLPQNVYVADATLFPESLGNPPMLTILAMAKRIGSIIRQKEL